MSRVVFSSKIFDIIRNFTDFRMAYFENLYSDTGIFSEDIIRQKYREESRELSRTFLSAIEYDIHRGIFGNIYDIRENDEYSRLVIKTGNHILIIWIRRNRTDNIVYIEDLEIRT